MDAPAIRANRKSVWDVLMGLQLGVIGGVLMLAWFALISPVLGYPWWLILNLLASHFYNEREVNFGPGVVTVVGAAMQIVSAGTVGFISGVLTPGGRLSGIGTAVVWYVICILFLWKRIAPLLLLPAIQPVLWVGYFVFGSALGWRQFLIRERHATLAG